MADRRSELTVRGKGWIAIAALALTVGLALSARPARREDRAGEVWTVLVETGDQLRAGRLTATLAGQPLTAGKAYLLAFHEAQDAGDLEHVLAVADRLDAAGEAELAAHVRRAADSLLDETAGEGPPPPGLP
jgi:hypothetical protein